LPRRGVEARSQDGVGGDRPRPDVAAVALGAEEAGKEGKRRLAFLRASVMLFSELAPLEVTKERNKERRGMTASEKKMMTEGERASVFFFLSPLSLISTSSLLLLPLFSNRASPRTSAPGSGPPPRAPSPAARSTARTTTLRWCTWERATRRLLPTEREAPRLLRQGRRSGARSTSTSLGPFRATAASSSACRRCGGCCSRSQRTRPRSGTVSP